MTPYAVVGDATIYCGDCRSIMGELGSVDLILTDPPYGIRWQSHARREGFDRIVGDDRIDTSWLPLAATVLRDRGALYMTSHWRVWPEWAAALSDAGLRLRDCIVWAKGGGGKGDVYSGYTSGHEFIAYATRGQHYLRGKRQPNVWGISKVPPAKRTHPTEKPVALWATAIEASSHPGMVVLDPFMGTGNALVAAVRAGRRAIGIEIDPERCAIAAERVQEAS